MKLVEQNCNDRSRDNAPPEVGIEAQKKKKKSLASSFSDQMEMRLNKKIGTQLEMD